MSALSGDKSNIQMTVLSAETAGPMAKKMKGSSQTRVKYVDQTRQEVLNEASSKGTKANVAFGLAGAGACALLICKFALVTTAFAATAATAVTPLG
nr:hypothetical protein [Alphaproteobacteria bacterium]